MNYSDLINPFDFANPVTEKKLFAGRKGELDDIIYYLKHGSKSSKPINLALIGDRAAGKTSLLNMIEIEAKSLKFLTVRIDLDEGDIINQLSFFFKIFDSIISVVIENGFFGGLNGAIYDEYLNQTCQYTISSDSSVKPFLFPLQYAKAMELNRVGLNVSEASIKKDLDVILQNINSPVILLFDECNVMAGSRVLLEKIRNIFMNKNNFMLVFTGTNDLFPVIDDIFSPIIRQFKKINVTHFEDEKDTKSCVNNPLVEIGIDPIDVFEYDTYKELHSISEGKPYEIQLICHNMFKRLQDKKATIMQLDHSVLEDVRQELETSQDFSRRPKLYDIKCLNKVQLNSLNYLCRSLKKCSINDILNLEFVVFGDTRVNRVEFNKIAETFVEKNIIYLNDLNQIQFFGDEFDKLYTKYYARERGVDFEFNYKSLYHNYFNAICKVLDITDYEETGMTCFYCLSNHNNEQIYNAINALVNGVDLDSKNEYLLWTYKSLFGIKNNEYMHYEMSLKISDKDFFIHFFCENEEQTARLEELKKGIEKRLLELKEDIQFVDFKLNKYGAVQITDLFTRMQINTKEPNEAIFEYHDTFYLLNYFLGHQKRSIDHCLILYELVTCNSDYIDSDLLNNLGYIFMLNSKTDLAKNCFDLIQFDDIDKSMEALIYYNKSIHDIMSGKDCMVNLQKAKSLLIGESYNYSCVIVPSKNGTEEIRFDELTENIDLNKIIDKIMIEFKE